MPLVSVVTCTYNRAHLIKETIQSVLNQTFQDFEYIIVDDGSDDNTEEVIQSYADSRLKYFKLERTGGHLSRLRNFSHTHCTGEFIAYVDSDDIWGKDKLEKQLAKLQRDLKIGFSFTDISIFNEDGIIRSSIYNKSGDFIGSVFPSMLRNELIICHTTLVLRKSCLEKTGQMDEQMHSGDHDLAFMLSHFFEAYVIYEPLVLVRKHNQNSTASHSLSLRLLKEHHHTLEKLFDKNLISRIEYLKAVASTSYSFGVQILPAKDYDSAARYFFKCVTITPWNIKAWVRLLFALSKQVIRF
ncbi:MAG: glycosyltransferase [Cyclobacteriaceae bacterium]